MSIIEKGIVYGLMAILSAAGRGRLIPVLFGALTGAALGSSLGLIHQTLFPFGAVFGAILGAALLGVLFPRAETQREDVQIGKAIELVTYVNYDATHLVAVTETLLYYRIFSDEEESLASQAVKALQRGIDPGLDFSIQVPLSTLQAIELRDNGTVARFEFGEGMPSNATIEFDSSDNSANIIRAIERALGVEFSRVQTTMPIPRALRWPVVLLAIQLLVTMGVAVLSAYWIANPPRLPVGKSEPDPLVATLTSLGPLQTLLYGLVICTPLTFWLLKRAFFPPQVTILSPTAVDNSTV